MNNILGKTNISKRELFLSLMLLLGFLTINIEILPIGEYQPIILVGLAIAAVFQDGKISYKLISIALILLLMTAIGLFFRSQGDFSAAVKLLVVIVYLLFGWRLVAYCNLWVLRSVIILSLIVIFLGVLVPSVITTILGFFFPRGVVYYMGFNSFFSSEPSYASLNLFGLYIMYHLRCSEIKKSYLINQDIISFLIIVILISTLSVTGIVFSMIIALNSLFIYASNSRKNKIVSLVFLFVAVGIIGLVSGFLENTRIAGVVYFISSAFDGNFLVNWLLLEPSSVVRFVSNVAGWYDGIGEIFGTGTFSLLGGASNHYPVWLSDAFSHIDIIGKGSSSQTPFFNIILHSGYVGLLFFVIIFIFIWKNLILLPRNIIFLVILFLFICSFWQAAITYPFYWFVLSYLINRRNNFSKIYSSSNKLNKILEKNL